NINDSIELHAKDHYYTKAIEEAKAAKAYFGNTPELTQKVKDLIVARSEFILFTMKFSSAWRIFRLKCG
uniref:hypothetical protein n=1 Tax=Vibrio vulnificus TaxID=672 RepID=UPI00057DE2D7